MRRKLAMTIMEKDKLRGAVPSRSYGIQDKVYNAYLDELGLRDKKEVWLALASSNDVRFKEVLDRLSTPKYRRVSLAAIAKGCGIDLAEFQKWWNKESTQRAIAIAQTRSVEITADMAKDALSTEVACPRCDGLKFIAAPSGLDDDTPGYRQITLDGEAAWVRTCPDCLAGKVRKPGDTQARDKILEMSGIIQKGRAAVVIQQNFGGAGHGSAIQDLEHAMTVDIDPE